MAKTVDIELDTENKTISVEGPVNAETPLMICRYDENGRFLGLDILQNNESNALPLTESAAILQMIWIDQEAKPESVALNIDLTEMDGQNQ